jgi:CHASE2 domain-containing sensor protein
MNQPIIHKRAVLRCDGSLEQGFRVTLEISDRGAPVFTEVSGILPSAIELAQELTKWQQRYRASLGQARISLEGITVQAGAIAQLEACRSTSKNLQNLFQQWLSAPGFQPIEQRLRQILSTDEFIEILLKSTDSQLHHLPWHLWDFIACYPNTELLISSPSERLTTVATTHERVRILAILGDRRGIDTAADRLILEQLPNAELVFLVEPSRQELHQHLWDQSWDILFFAGHSHTTAKQGCLDLNPVESLTLEELNYGLRRSISQGLQLAIFNSCDGLGLAYDLEQLHIPQLIVMREPVPDQVAQEFLKQFLRAFANGQPLHAAIRQAREYLQGLEGQFPCASWLPVMFQNSAAVALTWQDLQKTQQSTTSNKWSKFRAIPWAIAAAVACTGLVMGTRYFGAMEPGELWAYDQLMKMRPAEKPDSRFLIITVTEADIQAQIKAKELSNAASLSDKSLSKLFDKLLPYKPAIIALDIYRDFSVSKEYPILAKQLQESEQFIGICKVSDSTLASDGIAPPPEVATKYINDQIGFSDLLKDSDKIVRRQYLSMDPPLSSPCKTPYGLGVQIARNYLADKNIKFDFPNPNTWKIGDVNFSILRPHTGGYQTESALGHQIMLNYRASAELTEFAPKITLGQFLAGNFSPAEIQGKIVLIGTTSPVSHNDFHQTPYQSIPGVFLQGQMASQLISAVLDGRPLIRVWPTWIEISWIGGWSLIGGLLIYAVRRPLYLIIVCGVLILLLTGICLGLLQMGYWVPLLPTAIGLSGSAGLATVMSKRSSSNEKS